MGRWLALARADADEKNPNTAADRTLKTIETPDAEVSRVLRVPQDSEFTKISERPDSLSGGFEGFEGSPKGAFAEKFSAPSPASEPSAHPQVVEPETPEAAVARRLDAMAAENERRRGWTKVSPYEPDGSLVMRSALTGEGVTIYLPKGRTRH